MPEYIGNIEVPAIVSFGTFPFIPDYPHGRAHRPQIVVNRMGGSSANGKIEQRYLLGTGARRFTVRRAMLTPSERQDFANFWLTNQGPYGAFTYNAPTDDGTSTEAVTCRFEDQTLTFEYAVSCLCSIGLTLVEIPSSSPGYTSASTVERFPSDALETELARQVQELFVLVKIQPRTSGYPAIYLSDRKATVDGQLYAPRIVSWDGIEQGMNGETDQATFELGNADRVLTALANDVDLFRASIEFSLYHVNTDAKINLWKGTITDWQADSGPTMKLIAQDGLYELNLPYPPRCVSRTCWKVYGAARSGCPWADESGQVYTERTLPDGKDSSGNVRTKVYEFQPSESECDKGFDTPNGCLAHGMEDRFGGLLVRPQSVLTKDNTTGLFKIGRENLTSASMVNDTIYNVPLPEIYCRITNDDHAVGMPVNALIAEGRDEGDFYAAIGVLGEGPLGEFAEPNQSTGVNPHKLDGQDHHGWVSPARNNYGLRLGTVTGQPGCHGGNPETGSDRIGGTILGLSADGDENNISLGEGGAGIQAYRPSRAAGIAFAEMRRKDDAGLQPTSLADHSMVISVRQGLGTYIWPITGREWQSGQYNPVWIAAHIVLRALRIHLADASDQSIYFDLESLRNAAAICDEQVMPLIGDASQSEIQFAFNGVFREKKPLRDWLQEILNNCLGYFTFAFGKLKIGIRVNSSVRAAFNDGNVIWGSVKYSPLKPAFNHITGQFADAEYQFAANTVEVYDIDHAQEVGAPGMPLFQKSTIAYSGASTKSQVARLVATRLREELGGIQAATRKYARKISFKTTVLALNTEPGMVCSLDHPDMPTYPATLAGSSDPQAERPGHLEFRCKRWRLNSDYSIEIEGDSTHNEVYDLVVGPKPADVEADEIPTEDVTPGVWRFRASTEGDGRLRIDRISVGRNADGVRAGYFDVFHSDEASNRYGTVVGDLTGILSGAVDVSGVDVTRLNGDEFPASGLLNITIDGTLYAVESVTDGSHLILATDAGTLTGKQFTASVEVFTYSGMPPVEGEWVQVDSELMEVVKVTPDSAAANFGSVQVVRGALNTSILSHMRVNTAIVTIDSNFPNRMTLGTGLKLRPGSAIVLNDGSGPPYSQAMVNFYDDATGETVTNTDLGGEESDPVYQDVRLWRVRVTQFKIDFPAGFFRSPNRARFAQLFDLPAAGVCCVRGQLENGRRLRSEYVHAYPITTQETIPTRAKFTAWPHRMRTLGEQPYQYPLLGLANGLTEDIAQPLLTQRQPWRDAFADRIADEDATPIPTPPTVSAFAATALVSQGQVVISGTIDDRSVLSLSIQGANAMTFPAWVAYDHEESLDSNEEYQIDLACESIADWLNGDAAFSSYFFAEALTDRVLIYDKVGIGGQLVSQTAGGIVATTGGLFSQLGVLIGRRYAIAWSGSGYRSQLSPLSPSTGPTGDASRVEISGIPASGDARVGTVEIYAIPDGADEGAKAYLVAGVSNGADAAVDEVAEADLTTHPEYPGSTQPLASGPIALTFKRCGSSWFQLYIPADKSRSNVVHGYAMDPIGEGETITLDVDNSGGSADVAAQLR